MIHNENNKQIYCCDNNNAFNNLSCCRGRIYESEYLSGLIIYEVGGYNKSPECIFCSCYERSSKLIEKDTIF